GRRRRDELARRELKRRRARVCLDRKHQYGYGQAESDGIQKPLRLHRRSSLSSRGSAVTTRTTDVCTLGASSSQEVTVTPKRGERRTTHCELRVERSTKSVAS